VVAHSTAAIEHGPAAIFVSRRLYSKITSGRHSRGTRASHQDLGNGYFCSAHVRPSSRCSGGEGFIRVAPRKGEGTFRFGLSCSRQQPTVAPARSIRRVQSGIARGRRRPAATNRPQKNRTKNNLARVRQRLVPPPAGGPGGANSTRTGRLAFFRFGLAQFRTAKFRSSMQGSAQFCPTQIRGVQRSALPRRDARGRSVLQGR